MELENFFPNKSNSDYLNPYTDLIKEFNSMNTQKIIDQFMSSITLYDQLLLFWEMGTGNTCSGTYNTSVSCWTYNTSVSCWTYNTSVRYENAPVFKGYFSRGRELRNIFLRKPSKSIESEFQVMKGIDDLKSPKPSIKNSKGVSPMGWFQMAESIDDLKLPTTSIENIKSEFQCEVVHSYGESKGEKKCRDILQNIFGYKFINTRPDFLKNPVTGSNLELDCFNEYLNIAVEYNGPHHYSPKFHETKYVFQCLQYRDYIKKQLCKENNTLLIIVRYDIVDIEAFIVKILDQKMVVIDGIDYKLYFNGNQVYFIV